MTDKTMGKTHRLRTFFVVLCLILASITAITLYLLGSTPTFYQPTPPPPQGQVSPYLTHKLGPDFFNSVQLDKPFELVVEQQGLNEIFASQCPEPQTYGGFSFSAAVAAFTADKVVLMTTVGFKDASSVLSITAQPIMDQAGRVNLNINSVKLGAIPVTSLAKNLAQKYADEYIIPSEPELAPIVYGVLNNQPFEQMRSVSNYKIRVKKFTLEQGKLILQLEPVKEEKKN